jgi:hypothetical protein
VEPKPPAVVTFTVNGAELNAATAGPHPNGKKTLTFDTFWDKKAK